jgi:hypothetical protein
MSDLEIPDELVAAVREREAAFAAVRSGGGWDAASAAAERVRGLRGPLEAEHGSWAVTAALGLRLAEA